MKGTPRTRFAGWTLVASTVMVLAMAAVMMRTPARAAEGELGEHTVITDLGNYKYATYLYPNLAQAFYLPTQYETRFDIHNAKFWKVEYYDVYGETRSSLTTGIDVNPPQFTALKFDVAFYTPRGEQMHTIQGLRPNWWYSVPHNTTSLEYDRLQVRIRNRGRGSRDFRFVTLDPIDAVKGTPIPPGRDIHL